MTAITPSDTCHPPVAVAGAPDPARGTPDERGAEEAPTVPHQRPRGRRGDHATSTPSVVTAREVSGSAHPPSAVPTGGQPSEPHVEARSADPLDHPDARHAAEAAAMENLLRCWVREHSLNRPDGPRLRIALPASGTALLVPVRYWSPTGWHRFDPPSWEGTPDHAPRVDAVTLACLLGREAHEDAETDGAELVAQVHDSVRHTTTFIAARRRHPEPAPPADLFLTAEQSLLLGHPLHPTPKSREGFTASELPRYSPEAYGSFPLHWLAVDRSVLASESAWTEQGRALPADQLITRLCGDLRSPQHTVPLPLHPWQALELRHRPVVAALFDSGLLHDLGPHGGPWHPTSSLRTVHRPGSPAMLKLSLGVRITNSRRENLRKELHRGVEVHRLLRTGLAGQWQAAHPGFDIVRDPAWLAVDTRDAHGQQEPVPGLDVVLRHNPFRPHDDVVCVAALTAPRPWPGRTGMHSRLSDVVERLTAKTGRPSSAVAAEWFLRYLDHVVRPVLWLDAVAGVALEAHQQNTLVILDRDGWPIGGRYRDNQGYYFRESRREELHRRLPGIGRASDTFVSDDVADERFAYYLAVNNIFGLVGAFGSQDLVDEHVLLAAFRQFLLSTRTLGSPLPALLLEAPALRAKANLLTRLHGLDELVGPVDTQSLYVTITNPLHR
ncbi:IucA/IucC family protein [Streptomyces sp. NPDC059256]|uniref:IucA/IucC family protein n=1 Tax=Streptomyces sp. NPDC059256 TaxID=3346794 RepID=UPI0036A0278B